MACCTGGIAEGAALPRGDTEVSSSIFIKELNLNALNLKKKLYLQLVHSQLKLKQAQFIKCNFYDDRVLAKRPGNYQHILKTLSRAFTVNSKKK